MIRVALPSSHSWIKIALASMSASIIMMTVYGVVRYFAGSNGQHIRQTGSGPAYEARRASIRESVRLQKAGYAAWHKENDLPKAEALFKQALALVPGEPRKLYALAQVLDAQDKTVEARAAYRNVVRPQQGTGSTLQTDPTILMRYAALCKASGQQEEANDAYRLLVNNAQARRIDSVGDSFPTISSYKTDADVEAVAHVVAGIQLVKKGQDEKAAKHFDIANKLRPDLAIGHFYKGYALQSRGKLAEAKRAFEKAAVLGQGATIGGSIRGL